MLKLTSASRAVARMDWPSQSMFRMRERVFWGNLFMPIIYELICLASRVLVHLFCRLVLFFQLPYN